VLEQQAATSEVLHLISNSPRDLAPVFDAILTNATKLCDAMFGTLYLCEHGGFRAVSMHNPPPAYAEERTRTRTLHPHPDSTLARAAKTKQVAQIIDLTLERGYAERDPWFVSAAALGNYRTVMSVPLLKEGQLIGAMSIFRQEVRSFSEKQIELVKSFAAQAVIAIENVRLLNELRQRTNDLTEALEQQTATSEVLRVISSSPGELEPVFQAMLANAMRICEAKFGHLLLYDGEAFHPAALHDVPAAYRALWERGPVRPGPLTGLGRMASTKQAFQIPDLTVERAYLERDPLRVATVDLAGARSFLGVPMLKDDDLVGAIVIYRQEVRPFTDKQIALVANFANQAVIAIENVRLLNELRQRTAELEEKSHQLEEASQHKSQFLANMSHELRTPLNAILGYTELIIDNIYGETPEKMRTVLHRIESNGKHLLGLINDVLDLSKIEAGELTLSLADYSLKNVVQTVYSLVEPLALEKNIALKVDLAPDLPAGQGDERRITQVLLNLVGNAIKFTDEGEVAIKALSADGSFQVAVHDTGPGISKADQAKLFQQFQQADNSITKRKGGTGLGLAISKHIVEMHGGRIWLESTPGQGSTFSFTLPVRVEQQARPT
jgi:signal transduction histidine kinase